jgi:hypothetical protein
MSAATARQTYILYIDECNVAIVVVFRADFKLRYGVSIIAGSLQVQQRTGSCFLAFAKAESEGVVRGNCSGKPPQYSIHMQIKPGGKNSNRLKGNPIIIMSHSSENQIS